MVSPIVIFFFQPLVSPIVIFFQPLAKISHNMGVKVHWIFQFCIPLFPTKSHYSDVTWALKHLKWRVTQLFVHLLVQPNIKEHINMIKAPHHWPFVRGIHRWPVDSPHKGQWYRKHFLRHSQQHTHPPLCRLATGGRSHIASLLPLTGHQLSKKKLLQGIRIRFSNYVAYLTRSAYMLIQTEIPTSCLIIPFFFHAITNWNSHILSDHFFLFFFIQHWSTYWYICWMGEW